jgi:adenine-specific DNA-methyltransferase
VWRYEKSKFEKMILEDRIYWGENGNNFPRQKRFLSEVQSGIVPSTWWTREFAGDNQASKREIRSLFNEGEVDFETPKPTTLIQRLLEIAASDNDIILDFFAGSATTAHAVLDLNRQDGGNRKFILVQLPEPCAPESEAFKAGYRTIADIGKERIRRVINKLNTEDEGKLDLDRNGRRDRGFKVLKLDKSNFKQWQPLQPTATPEQILDQLSLHIAHIEPQAKPEDLLYEILLKSGIMLTEPVEVVRLAGKTVHSVADGYLMLCLEETVTKELIDAVIEADPQQFICLDSAFHGNDQLKANAVQTFAARNMQKEKHNQIVFKTV